MRVLLIFFLLALVRNDALAAGPFSSMQVDGAVTACTSDSAGSPHDAHVGRALAAAIAITLGPFGGHRLYLGTAPTIPLIYAVTFGGFGVLVLIDLGHILFTKDLSTFQNSSRVFMWAKDAPVAATPP